ncbi:MAG: IS701 family transposase [Gammaproteobacteria bacterium]|nr:IS701 family transposase [bacterium]MCP5089531.1 IS701 family transposase [Gammaproteobacteria bacterium]
MERRFELRKEQLMEECEVSTAAFRGTLARLQRFVEPFAECLWRQEQKDHAQEYICGLLSDLRRKNTESIAYRHDQERQALQHFLGQSRWDHRPLQEELLRQVSRRLGRPTGVIVIDPSGFPKSGTESVGVKPQWCGRLGKVENCQVGIYMGYASEVEHALVDVRLYLPKTWAKDKDRRKKCHVPKEARYRSRGQLALEMLRKNGPSLPHAWVTGDEEFGRPSWFRRVLREENEQYLLTVPCDTTVRDLETQPPPYRGSGTRAKTPFVRVDQWCAALPESAWTLIDVRDGEKGPLLMKIAKCRVQARDERGCVGPEETLVVIRRQDENGNMIEDYYLSNASIETPLAEFTRAAAAHHRVEECIQRGKSEAGLADYEVRTYHGWYHHQALSLLAVWFLINEAQRGKKGDARIDGPPSPKGDFLTVACSLRLRRAVSNRPRMQTPTPTESDRTPLSLEIA